MPRKARLQDTYEDPPVTLDAAWVDQLESLASAAMDRVPDVADRLLQEIERAAIVPSSELPADVATIGSEVSFRDETAGTEQTVVLVLPQDADIAARRVSVLTPVGAALIGLAAGASITWETRDGKTRKLTVTAVAPARAQA